MLKSFKAYNVINSILNFIWAVVFYFQDGYKLLFSTPDKSTSLIIRLLLIIYLIFALMSWIVIRNESNYAFKKFFLLAFMSWHLLFAFTFYGYYNLGVVKQPFSYIYHFVMLAGAALVYLKDFSTIKNLDK